MDERLDIDIIRQMGCPCPACGHDLSGIDAMRCGECGGTLSIRIVGDLPMRRDLTLAYVGLSIIIGLFGFMSLINAMSSRSGASSNLI